MAILNFFIPPMSAELKQRTHEAHVISGIYHYLTQEYVPGKLPEHPLRLASVLGLQASQHGIRFYPAVAANTSPIARADAC
jgi:hypothetical protein